MLVCHCTLITTFDIETLMARAAEDGVPAPATPGQVFRALGKRPVCGTCFGTISLLLSGRPVLSQGTCMRSPALTPPASRGFRMPDDAASLSKT